MGIKFSSEDAATRWAETPLVFLWAAQLIGPLEELQKALADIEPKLALRREVLVEGESEAEFLRVIQQNLSVLNFDFSICVYGGKAQTNNLIRYIQERNRQGVRVDLVYDSDRQSESSPMGGCIEYVFRVQ